MSNPIKKILDAIRIFKDLSIRNKFPKEPEGSKDRCPVCGTHWDHHDFGVPHPYCPQQPLPGQSWMKVD